jgi:hypothetical protein
MYASCLPAPSRRSQAPPIQCIGLALRTKIRRLQGAGLRGLPRLPAHFPERSCFRFIFRIDILDRQIDESMKGLPAIFDGEIVCVDRKSRPRFNEHGASDSDVGSPCSIALWPHVATVEWRFAQIAACGAAGSPSVSGVATTRRRIRV